jgi:hypothetical protein
MRASTSVSPATWSSATTAPSTTSPVSRSRTPCTPTCTTTWRAATPAASWSSTCPTCPRRAQHAAVPQRGRGQQHPQLRRAGQRRGQRAGGLGHHHQLQRPGGDLRQPHRQSQNRQRAHLQPVQRRVQSDRETASSFDPYPETIYLYDNRYGPAGEAPDREALDQLRQALFGEDGRLPDIVWDGIVDPGKPREGREICIEEQDAGFLNIDAANDYASPSTDLGPHACRHERLAAITLAFDG